jgi:hypothetical protein
MELRDAPLSLGNRYWLPSVLCLWVKLKQRKQVTPGKIPGSTDVFSTTGKPLPFSACTPDLSGDGGLRRASCDGDPLAGVKGALLAKAIGTFKLLTDKEKKSG